MSFQAVFDFISFITDDPGIYAEVRALSESETDVADVTSFAAQRGFEFSEEEYRFLQPYALVLSRDAKPTRNISDLDEILENRIQNSNQTRATLLGNSHASVIRLAADATGFPLTVYSFMICPQPYVNSLDPAELSSFHPTIAESIATGPVFSAIGRSMHECLFLMQHPRKFDFVSPDSPEAPLEPDAEIIPFDAFRRACENALELDLKLIALARKSSSGPFFHIMVQPPLEDDALALAMTPFGRDTVPIFEVSKSALRMKIYKLFCEIIVEWCDQHQIPILLPPAAAVNERGYLKPEFALNTTHGNQAYGELVLDQMRSAL